MAVTLSKIYETTTAGDLPNAAATTWTQGINAPSGPVEYFIVRADLDYTGVAVPYTSDFGQLISSLRIVLNGEVLFDFRSSFNQNTGVLMSRFNYLLNNIGGRCYEVPSTGSGSVKEAYIAIPLGKTTSGTVDRYEVIMNWSAAATTPASGKLEYWLQYNDSFAKQTYVVPSTSFTHANAIEQVTVRVPQAITGVVSALYVQNDSAADELGTNGIRVNGLSAFGIETQMYRWLNGDLANRNKSAVGATGAGQDPNNIALGTSQQIFNLGPTGGLLIPLFGMAGGDIVLQVDSTAATTRTYTPIITSPVGTRERQEVRQTQMAPSNTANSIIRDTLD
tara:strand:- start:745 stop:1752 length:1008 start_codon:yes stop_codon:yes gene_type:complete